MSYVPSDEDMFIETLLRDPRHFSKQKDIALVCILARLHKTTCEEISKDLIEVTDKIQEVWRGLE